MKPFYMMIYTNYTGEQFTEWFDDTYEAWLRYEELTSSETCLKCVVYTKMLEFTPKAE